MAHSPNAIPMGPGNQVETRPLYVEEWLDSLPYADFLRTARLIEEATRATNTQTVKAATRLELVEIYNRPYQYYVESQIRAGAQHTLQSIETMQGQIGLMKQIAVNLALACRLSADEILKQKTSWRQTKPPLPAYLGALHYLSHAMIFGFLEYAPIPKNVWRQLHSMYEFAESIQRELEAVPLPGQKNVTFTIADAYKRIVLAALVDPHHLPFGAIWEVYEQLRHWTRHVQLRPFEPMSGAGGCFVIDLDSDNRPLTPDKQGQITAVKRARILDCAALAGVVEDQIDRLDAGQPLSTESRLSPYFARVVLGQMLRAWGVPPSRHFPREPRSGTVTLVRGMHAIFYHLNGEQEFDPGRDPEADDQDDWHTPAPAANSPTAYAGETWSLVDQGQGGFAVISSDRPPQTVRVGDLVAFAVDTGGRRAWVAGIVRWLMVRQGRSHRLGAQILGGRITAAGVRAVTGSRQDRRFRRALLVQGGAATDLSLITERGFHVHGRELQLRIGPTLRTARAGPLAEGTVAFERFPLL
jgi:hypothetical protein